MCIVQVSVPGLQARYGHRAAAFSITPALTLVTIFGGKDNKDKFLANTTVFEFGESTCMLKNKRITCANNGIGNASRAPINNRYCLRVAPHLT